MSKGGGQGGQQWQAPPSPYGSFSPYGGMSMQQQQQPQTPAGGMDPRAAMMQILGGMGGWSPFSAPGNGFQGWQQPMGGATSHLPGVALQQKVAHPMAAAHPAAVAQQPSPVPRAAIGVPWHVAAPAVGQAVQNARQLSPDQAHLRAIAAANTMGNNPIPIGQFPYRGTFR